MSKFSAATLPHEGLDFCLFNDRWGRLFRLEEGTRIPAMYGGTVVAIIDDFLGTSIALEHRLPERGGPFLTIYGHTVVRKALRHVSLALPSEGAPYDRLAWRDLNDPGLFTMIDPLDVIGGPYLVLEGIEESPEPIGHDT